jgi:hypothetical protein
MIHLAHHTLHHNVLGSYALIYARSRGVETRELTEQVYVEEFTNLGCIWYDSGVKF